MLPIREPAREAVAMFFDRRAVAAAIVATLLILAGKAFGAEPPKFTVVNKCPPSFTVTNKMPAREVRVQPPFTQTGTLTEPQRAGVLSSSYPVTYPMARTRTLAPWTGQSGVIVSCGSVG